MIDSEGKMEQPYELYCDDCGAVLQSESCNHVRACTKCSITASIKLRNAEELRDSRGELLAKLQLQLATAESDLVALRRELEETKKERNFTYCSYCGASFPLDDPEAAKVAVTNHIYECVAHPMRAVENRVKQLSEELDKMDLAYTMKRLKLESAESDLARLRSQLKLYEEEIDTWKEMFERQGEKLEKLMEKK